MSQRTIATQANRAQRKCRTIGLPHRYRPTLPQWKVMYALRDGPLPTSLITVAGGHVAFQAADRLAAVGLVSVDDGMASLTPAGRARLDLGW